MAVIGGNVVARNIMKFGGGFIEHVNKTMETVKKELDTEVTKNMSLQDHSLQDLAALGHPYAARHGSHGLPIHDPHWQVHIQSGQLLESKSAGTVDAGFEGGTMTAKAWVGLDENKAAHALFVIFGTSKMIPRDFLLGSLEIKRQGIYGILSANLKHMVVNFRAEGTRA